MTFAAYLTQWLETERSILRASTYESLETYINRHIIPFFGDSELEALKPLDIQQYANVKLHSGRLDGKQGGLSLLSVKKHISVIKQALKDAELYGYIQRSPATAVKLPRNKSTMTKRVVFLEAGQAQKIIDALTDEPLLQLAVSLALLYGLRRSEVLGLRWQSIDFIRNTLTIDYTVVKNLTIHESNETKTEASNATYELLPEVRTALLSVKTTSYGKYVFSKPDGSVMRPDSLTRTFQRRLKKHGFPVMRFHDLRHSTASILFARGWSLEDVKAWLRHSDIETTSNIYLHYQQSRKILVGGDLAGMIHITKSSES